MIVFPLDGCTFLTCGSDLCRKISRMDFHPRVFCIMGFVLRITGCFSTLARAVTWGAILGTGPHRGSGQVRKRCSLCRGSDRFERRLYPASPPSRRHVAKS